MSGESVDHGWVMQVTFITTLAVGVPVVVVLTLLVDPPTWQDRIEFVVGVGAAVWFVTALAVYGYARVWSD